MGRVQFYSGADDGDVATAENADWEYVVFCRRGQAADGEQGTVQAALASGQRAAGEILASLTNIRPLPALPVIPAAA